MSTTEPEGTEGTTVNSVRLPAAITALFIAAAAVAHAGVPKIMCRQPVYDFGTLNNTSRIEHAFHIYNNGDVPLEIGKLRACCGASMSISSKTIAPGTNAHAKVSFSLRGRKGRQRKSFYIASNDPTKPHLQLRLEGTAVAHKGAGLQSVNFGRISPDALMEKQVQVTCGSGAAFTVTGLVSTVAQLSATCEETAAAKSHAITVRTVPPLPLGAIRGKVRVLTDSEKCPEIRIRVRAMVASDLIVVPREIILAEQSGSPKPVTRYVMIRSRSAKRFSILNLQAPHPGIKIETRALAAGAYRLALTDIVPGRNLDGRELLITTDQDSPKVISIPFRVVPGSARTE